MIEAKLEKLAAAGIDLVPVAQMARHFVFTRDSFVCLVERRAGEFGAIGAAGLATEAGFAALSWRGGQPFFIARAYHRAASPVEVEQLRAFEADLRAALA